MESLPPRVRRALELGAVLLVLGAATVPRARDLAGEFDRDFDGFAGSFFAICAVNYARQGPGAFHGYPVQDVDRPAATPEAGAPAGRVTLYANHPPLLPLVAWLSAELFGPDGWRDAWREGRAPEGLELPMRLPAFLFHLAGLVAFYLAVREGAGVQRALLSLAVLAATPVSIVYAGLLNYENPALALVLVAALFHVRYLKRGETRDLVLFGVAALVGCAVTFFHLFFVPPLVAQAFLRRSPGARDHAVRLAAAAALGAALPIALHAWLSSLAFERASQPPSLLASRIEEMLRPLVDGSVPFPAWLGFQLARAARYLSEPILVAAVVGAVLAAARALRPGPSRGASPADGGPAAVELTLPLLAGAGLLLVVMFRHTADGIGGGDGQASFVLHLAPGAAAAAGLVLDALSRPLLRLRGGVAPLVVLTSLVCLPAVARANELRRPWREPGPRDDPSLETGPAAPLPSTVGRELNRLLPAGDAAVYPSSLGLTPAHIYYAWRSLLPVDVASAGSLSLAGTRIADHRGETWILVPRSGPRAAVTAGETLHAFIAERVPSVVGEPEVATEHWWLWRLAR